MIQLIWAHFVLDFICQDDVMAKKKSSNWLWLALHCTIYGSGLCLVMPTYWATANALVHLMIDAITSRVTSKLWANEEWHWFFVVVGLDQALHMTCLWATWTYLM